MEFFKQYRGIQKSNTAQAYRITLVECPTTREEPRNIYPVILRRDLCMTLSSLSSTDVFNIPQILLRTPPDHMFDVYTLQYNYIVCWDMTNMHYHKIYVSSAFLFVSFRK